MSTENPLWSNYSNLEGAESRILHNRLTWDNVQIASRYASSIAQESETSVNVTKKLYHDPIFYALLPSMSRVQALDVGCGNFYMSYQLKMRSPLSDFYAVDYPETIKQAQQEYADRPDILASVHAVGAAAQNLPFANDTFDVTTSSLMLHWAKDAERIASEMFRVTKPDGTCLVSLAHPETYKTGRFEGMETDNPIFIPTVDTTKRQELEVYLDDMGPLTYYLRPVRDYKKIYEEAGFSNVQLYAPTLDKSDVVMMRHPFMKKHIIKPLYLFIKAEK